MNQPILSKLLFLLLFVAFSVTSLSDESFFAQISSLWENGENEKVLAIAHKRIQTNSKDVAGLILQLEYQIAFHQLDDLPETADRLLSVGDNISTANFHNIWPTVRADIEVIKMMVSKYPEKDLEADRKKAPTKGKPMTYGKLIKAIEDDGLLGAGKLWGICEVAINEAAGTVTLVDARYTGSGRGLAMYDCQNKRASQVTLKVNQHCILSDGHHASMKYVIKSIKDGIVEVAVTERFDARSFGKEVTEKTETISVKSYKDRDTNPDSTGSK